jgi:integrase
MPRRPVGELTPKQLNRIVADIAEHKRNPGFIRVGGVSGLALNVRKRKYASGEDISASWILRMTLGGVRRDFALGGWPTVTLAMAREKARRYVDKIADGIDPVAEKRERLAAVPQASKAPTFRDASQEFFNRTVRGRIGARDEAKWHSDLEAMAFPVIGDLPVDQITVEHLVAMAEQPYTRYGSDVEQKLWDAVPDRARRMYKKVEAILTAETRLGHRSGENPALWTGNLQALLPKPPKRPKGQPALPYEQLPDFLAALRARDVSSSSLALEFLILTAARSGEVRGMVWSEVDLDKGIWSVPAERMKADRPHRVPLSPAAVRLLKAAPRYVGCDLVFPGKSNKPMSDMTLASLVKKLHAAELEAGRPGFVDPNFGRPAVPHGFRASFSTWAAETTDYPSAMVEISLAHVVGNEVERAYKRTDQLEKRRELMTDWADHALASVGHGSKIVG